MKKLEQKSICFLKALLDVYRDEENRELSAFSVDDDVTEDITALLVAMKVVVERISEFEGDIIDFTHMLNKLAVQLIMENHGEVEDG